jgi:hypothetical protein
VEPDVVLPTREKTGQRTGQRFAMFSFDVNKIKSLGAE